MRRSGSLLALVAAAALVLAPALADARAGSGASMGSRGFRTYSPPPVTNTAPSVAAPFERSMTPRQAPGAPAYGMPGSTYGGRSPFMSGLMGGLIGAGIGGLLFGGGLFGGINGFGGFLGFLLQIFLLVMIGRWLLRMLFRQPAFAGAGMFARRAAPQTAPRPVAGGGSTARPVAIGSSDYQEFERLLKLVQGAWSAHDVNTIRGIASPEMVSYFAEQIGEQERRGVRNTVTDVRLEQGDLAEAWAEQGREYATVAMRFSMVDVTRDQSGRVVDGSPTERVTATEIWTFVRSPGGRWQLSAIQQTR
jgi:predicted lipid-binding transport protein (Tim44 family)